MVIAKMKFHVKFVSFYDFTDDVLTLLHVTFPSLRSISLGNVQAICWLYKKVDKIAGVSLIIQDEGDLILNKLFCFDLYNEKRFITLIRKYVGNDMKIRLKTTKKDYFRLSNMELDDKYTPIEVMLEDDEPTDQNDNEPQTMVDKEKANTGVTDEQYVEEESHVSNESRNSHASSIISVDRSDTNFVEKRKSDTLSEEVNGIIYKIFLQQDCLNSELKSDLGIGIGKSEVVQLYEHFTLLIGTRIGVSVFDMNNNSSYKNFMNRKDGEKILLITLYNNTPVSWMIIRDLTEREDKNASFQITQFYSTKNIYMGLTYCHFYKWVEQTQGEYSLIRLESPKKDLNFYKEMNMVVDTEWNLVDGTHNNRMAIVGKDAPPHDYYQTALKKVIEKKQKTCHSR